MEISTVLVKVVGIVFLAWTVRSIIKHLKEQKEKPEDAQSTSEKFLNSFIYYLWLAFMTVFSFGMIFNN